MYSGKESFVKHRRLFDGEVVADLSAAFSIRSGGGSRVGGADPNRAAQLGLRAESIAKFDLDQEISGIPLRSAFLRLFNECVFAPFPVCDTSVIDESSELRDRVHALAVKGGSFDISSAMRKMRAEWKQFDARAQVSDEFYRTAIGRFSALGLTQITRMPPTPGLGPEARHSGHGTSSGPQSAVKLTALGIKTLELLQTNLSHNDTQIG